MFDRDDAWGGHEDGLSVATLKAFRRALGPSAGSEELQTSMLNHIKSILDNIDTSQVNKVDLYAWVKHAVTQATMRAIYGPDNPFMKPCP